LQDAKSAPIRIFPRSQACTEAALPPLGQTGAIDETLWTERPDKPIFQYPRAKTLAERDAWAFVPEKGRGLKLTTVLPGFIPGR
jgi:hypothetical protein